MNCLTTVCRKYAGLLTLILTGFLSLPAHAGHLFTQASRNTPVNLTAGNGIQITQLTFEGVGTAGNVSLNFNGDWGTGDAIKITIGSYTQTLHYDSALSGTTQTASALVVNDPTLAAAGIHQAASMKWTVIADSGTFTFTGYRIYIADGTFNGTGADTINQTQVVSASSLTGGGSFVPDSSPHNVGLAHTLDALNGNASGDLATAINYISAMTPESRQLALKLIAPNAGQAVSHSAMNTSSAGVDTVQVRLDSLRTGAVDVARNFQQHDGDHVGDVSSHDQKASADNEGLSSGDETLKRNLWLKAFGGRATQDAKDGYAGFNDHIYGSMLGYDDRLPGGMVLGAALGFARTDVNMTDYRSGDGADISTYQVTGYMSRVFDRWYLNGMLTYAMQDYDTTRDTGVSSLIGAGKAQGNFKGSLYGLRVIAGMPIDVRQRLTVTPFGGVEANHVTQHAYTETGAGALSLDVGASSADRLRSIIGTEVSTPIMLRNGSVLRPSVKPSWRHEFKDEGVNTVTSLTGGGGSFETIGQAVNRDIYALSLRLNWEKSEISNISIEITGEAGEGYRSVAGEITGGWHF